MRAEAGQLLDSCTEDIVVFIAGALDDFDICAVICSESYGTVYHELHVARAACLGSGSRDLLRNICGGNDMLGIGTVVV